jgi:N-acetylglucosamine-6-phosphate deacetylase
MSHGAAAVRLGVAAAVIDGEFTQGDVEVVDGVITAVGLPGSGSGVAIPRLIDLQVNGFAGIDLLTAPIEGWHEVARALAARGVGGFVANLITSDPEVLARALATASIVQRERRAGAAELIGVNLEGPYLSPAKAGTHPVAWMREPNASQVDDWLTSPVIVGMTIAPELPGALQAIEKFCAAGKLVSLGHSGATASEAHAGFDAGAQGVTHIFNAMSGPTSRDAGLAGVALTRANVAAQMLCDRVHLSDDVARLVFASAADRVVLVSDAMAAAGLGDGDFVIGGMPVQVRDGIARNEAGAIAGSAHDLAHALRVALDLDYPVALAVAAATARPADLIGRPDLGRTRVGGPADVVVLQDDHTIRAADSTGR